MIRDAAESTIGEWKKQSLLGSGSAPNSRIFIEVDLSRYVLLVSLLFRPHPHTERVNTLNTNVTKIVDTLLSPLGVAPLIVGDFDDCMEIKE